MNLWDTPIKYIFFSVFFLFTINGRHKDIIVELKALFVLNGPFITFSGGSHHHIFRILRKIVPTLAFNSVIVATNPRSLVSGTGMLVVLSDIFFYTGTIFLIFVKKCKKWKWVVGSSPNSDFNFFFGNVVFFCVFCVVFNCFWKK